LQGVACEFEFERKSENLAGSLAGMEDVILIKITKNHRRCDFDFNDAKFKGEGLRILAATPWKQGKGGVFERKVKVLYDDVPQAELQMLRNCKEGLMIETYKIDVNHG